jgi:hypothetical protein
LSCDTLLLGIEVLGITEAGPDWWGRFRVNRAALFEPLVTTDAVSSIASSTIVEVCPGGLASVPLA